MKIIDFDDYLDQQYGPIGTPERDAFEAEVAEEIRQSRLRRERKEARKAKLKSIVMPLVNAIKTPQLANS